MLKQINFFKYLKKRQSGFSLIMVLLFALFGFAASSAALLFYENYHRRSESLLIRQEEYHAMQNAIESARLRIREEGYPQAGEGTLTTPFAKLADLVSFLHLLSYDVPVKISGRSHNVTVDIFDSNIDWNDPMLSGVRTEILNDSSVLAKQTPTPPLIKKVSKTAGFEALAVDSASTLLNDRTNPTSTFEDNRRLYTIRASIDGKKGRALELLTLINIPDV